jgi:TRAP-type C4-dicarboxylate transport system substrate-binding protein
VYSRAGFWRTVATTVALSVTVVPARAVAREFRAAIDLNRSHVALIGHLVPAIGVLAVPLLFRSIAPLQKMPDGSIGGETVDSFEPYGFVAAVAELIDRIRKVE